MGALLSVGGGDVRVAVLCLRSAILGLCLFCFAVQTQPAAALEPITISADQDRIEITTLGAAELYEGRGESFTFDTAPGGDGVAGRMSVRAKARGASPNWMVFALKNPTDKTLERWLTAERYTVVGSGAIWPNLDARRIEAVTPSLGFLPERVKSDHADIFRITLEPGQTITYVAELSSGRLARIYLWKPFDYELKARDRQLFNGIMLGISGVLGLFLTVIFAANQKAIFPAAALVAWSVLAYLCVDFGFWHKLFQLRPEDNAVYRAATEAAVAASLVVFLHTFLRLALWHGFVRMLLGVWIAAQLALIAAAVIDARLAATFARVSFFAIGGAGAALTAFLALRGQDRALALVPTWILFLVWIFGASMVLNGRLGGDMFVSGMTAGLVLIIVLIGFTVTQFAFRSIEPAYGVVPGELQLRAQAVEAAGAAVWEWHARRDEIKVGAAAETTLGLKVGELSAKVATFLEHMHPADRERFRLTLWSVQMKSGGGLRVDFRMRHADNSYRWFDLEAASVPTVDRRSVRCVGLMRDVTEVKRAHERLTHDAVHDNLTGLPTRELFADRLNVALTRAKNERQTRPTVLFIDIDKFRSVNSSFGLIVGDSLLLTVARRLARHVGEEDTLARVGGDQFAMLILSIQDPRELGRLADRLRHALRAPITIAGQEIVLTGSLGMAVYDGQQANGHDLFKEAEIAMYRAKRGGSDKIELFMPEMRVDIDDRVAVESDLRKAIERNQLRIVYQPIIHLPTEELAGFEALVRWDHPRRGALNPGDFIPAAEESDLIVKLGSYVLNRAAHEAARWHSELPRHDNPLFVSVNVSTRQLFCQDLIQEIRHILGRAIVPKGTLQLEITESLVMENPEQAIQMLDWLRGAGASLALDDFGTGYSSIAYLQRLPFDTIKLDRALVHASSGDVTGATIVRAIVALATELDKKIVAEGVETVEDGAFLRSIGCHYAQGFYYGEPMSERDVSQLLKVMSKSERKLARRGFFRTRSKPKPRLAPAARDEAARAGYVPVAGAQPDGARSAALADRMAAARPAGANGAGAADRPRAVSQLPASTIRPRQRALREAEQARASKGPPPVPPVLVHSSPPGSAPARPQTAAVPPPLPPAARSGRTKMPAAGTAPPVAPSPPRIPRVAASAPPPVPAAARPAPPPPPRTAPPAAAAAPPPLPAAGQTHPPVGAGAAQPPPQRGVVPDLSKLPPQVAASLARLAGMAVDSTARRSSGTREAPPQVGKSRKPVKR